MQQPRKRHSSITENLEKNKDPKESFRTRNNMLLAVKIIAAIKNNGWNKTQFANRIDKKPSVITRWLSGTHNFTSDTLSDIGFILGINLFDLGKEPKNDAVIASSTGNVSINIFKEMPDYSELVDKSFSVERQTSGIQVLETVCADLN